MVKRLYATARGAFAAAKRSLEFGKCGILYHISRAHFFLSHVLFADSFSIYRMRECEEKMQLFIFPERKRGRYFLLELKFGFNYVVSFVTTYLLHAIIFFVKNVTYILPLLYCA